MVSAEGFWNLFSSACGDRVPRLQPRGEAGVLRQSPLRARPDCVSVPELARAGPQQWLTLLGDRTGVRMGRKALDRSRGAFWFVNCRAVAIHVISTGCGEGDVKRLGTGGQWVGPPCAAEWMKKRRVGGGLGTCQKPLKSHSMVCAGLGRFRSHRHQCSDRNPESKLLASQAQS